MACRRFVSALGLVLLSSFVVAQVTVLRPYSEKENPNTPVRGHAVVGVAVMPRDGDQELDRLFVYAPGRQGQVLSIDVTTANGRVQGDALVKVDTPAGTSAQPWAELQLPKRFRRSDPEGLTVGVQTPNDPSGAFYIASWGRIPDGPVQDLQIWLYVNRGRAPQAFLYWDADKGLGQACTPAQSTTALRFNTICRVRLGDIRRDGRLRLVRRDGGTVEPQDIVLVR